MNWIRKHRVLTQLFGFLLTGFVFDFVGWEAGIVAVILSVIAYEVITRTGKKEDTHNA